MYENEEQSDIIGKSCTLLTRVIQRELLSATMGTESLSP